jgi:ABC-type sugar transport system ATPase subunit
MPILEVEEVSKRFGSLEALREVTFRVEQGEIFGIAGLNGAGKSVLFKVLGALATVEGKQIAREIVRVTGRRAGLGS